MPTFNRPHYLSHAIESVLAQTFRDFELVVVDDGNDEHTPRLVAEYSDPRITYRRNPRNLGQLLTNVSAFRRSRAKYVSNLHDDDIWEPDFLATLVPLLEANADLVAAFSDHWVMDAEGRVDPDASNVYSRQWGRDTLERGVHKPFIKEALVDRSSALAIAGLMRRDAMDWADFPPEVGILYDVWLSYLASRDGNGAWFEPRRLARYRIHAASDTATKRMEASTSAVFLWDRLARDTRLREYSRLFARRRAEARTTRAISLLRTGNVQEARRELRRSVCSYPSRRGCAAFLVSLLPRRVARSITASVHT